LWQADITGSLAHAEMLGHQGIIGKDDQAASIGASAGKAALPPRCK
jgi:argininosuccinate lyase